MSLIFATAKPASRIIAPAMIAALMIACGPGDVGEPEYRPDLVKIGVGKSDGLPSWMRPVSDSFTCGDTITGVFNGADSAHLFHFYPPAAVEGSQTIIDFRFDGHYPWHQGSAIALYGANSGQLAQLLRNPADSHITLSHRTAEDEPLVVAIYSLTWSADGYYDLRAKCRHSATTSVPSR